MSVKIYRVHEVFGTKASYVKVNLDLNRTFEESLRMTFGAFFPVKEPFRAMVSIPIPLLDSMTMFGVKVIGRTESDYIVINDLGDLFQVKFGELRKIPEIELEKSNDFDIARSF